MNLKEYKLVFAGTMGAGKTTAIAAISDIPPVRTDVANTDRVSHAKSTTTVGLDYGEVTLSGGHKLRLYGAPGQARFDFMWRILATGALGIVILVDNSQRDPISDLRQFLLAFRDNVFASRAVIGLSRTDAHPLPDLKAFSAAIQNLGFNIPILSVDCRQRRDVLLLLDVLFHQIEIADDGVDALETAEEHV